MAVTIQTFFPWRTALWKVTLEEWPWCTDPQWLFILHLLRGVLGESQQPTEGLIVLRNPVKGNRVHFISAQYYLKFQGRKSSILYPYFFLISSEGMTKVFCHNHQLATTANIDVNLEDWAIYCYLKLLCIFNTLKSVSVLHSIRVLVISGELARAESPG